MNSSENTNTAIVRPYQKKDLERLYGVSSFILNTWLKPFEIELGERIGLYYNTRQVRIIFEKLGAPSQEMIFV